eukprot:6300726-Amphidinium_carterae.1
MHLCYDVAACTAREMPYRSGRRTTQTCLEANSGCKESLMEHFSWTPPLDGDGDGDRHLRSKYDSKSGGILAPDSEDEKM